MSARWVTVAQCGVVCVILSIHQRYPALATSILAAGALVGAGAIAVRHFLPVAYVTPFARTAGNEGHLREQPYFVGVRQVPGSKAEGRPPMVLYYPTATPPPQDKSKWPLWVPFGDLRYARGLCDYANAPHIWAYMQRRNRVVAAVDAPLLPASAAVLGSAAHPVVVFSHGLSGHRMLYSALLMDLAARGAVALALEHGDGSACMSLQPTAAAAAAVDGESSFDAAARAEAVAVPYETLPARYSPKGGGADAGNRLIFAMRRRQLEHRMGELTAVGEFVVGGGLHASLGLGAAAAAAFATGVSRGAAAGRPFMLPLAGHSFGSAAVLQAALRQPTDRAWWAPCVVTVDLWAEAIEEQLPSMIAGSAARFAAAKADGAAGARDFPATRWVESEQWERWCSHRELEEAALPLWPPPTPAQLCRGVTAPRRQVMPHVDHFGQSDVGLMVNLPVIRKKYCRGTEYDRRAIFEHSTSIWEVVRSVLAD